MEIKLNWVLKDQIVCPFVSNLTHRRKRKI